ncbi:MAG: IS4 family transposase [Chloroflexota bacterium]
MLPNAQEWAEQEFGNVELGDKRREERALEIAAQLARRPSDSLPQQMGSWAAQKATYRLLDNNEVSYEALSQPHWQRTRQCCDEEDKTILFVQDITELDYSSHKATEGLGPIGDHNGRGMLLHNTLALQADTGEVMGLAYQQVWQRPHITRKRTETRTQRRQRADKQSSRWLQAVREIGKPTSRARWVHVADRECDIFDFFQTSTDTEIDFCVRILQNRRIGDWSEETPRYLVSDLRQLDPMGYRTLTIPAQTGQPKREAHLAISWQSVTIRSPRNRPGKETRLDLWAVRIWEPNPDPDSDPIEWVLLTSVPVETVTDAIERIDWYTHRWVVEEYHKCLKTGCGMEKRRLQKAQRLHRLLAFLSILAIRLLQLRDWARSKPHLRAIDLIQPLLVQIIAARTDGDPNTMTVRQFWHAVAQVGGFPQRASDGEPGWERLWHGWLRLLDWAEGVSLANDLPPIQDVGNC